MRKHSLAVVVFGPIALYLLAMIVLAGAYLQPPLLGWLGLGIVSVVALSLGAVAYRLYPRLGINAARVHHPELDDRFRLLVVSLSEVDPAELEAAVAVRLVGRRGIVKVVAPLAASTVHLLTADEEPEGAAAAERLEHVLGMLARAGITASGEVGTDDPLQATGDALAEFPADEVLLLATVPARRDAGGETFERRARDLFGVPVTPLYGAARHEPQTVAVAS